MTNATNDTELRLTMIGGPTVLIEYHGLRLLTDPTFDPAGREYPSGPVVLKKTAGPAVRRTASGRSTRCSSATTGAPGDSGSV